LLNTIRQGEVLGQFRKILESNRSLRALSLKYHDCMDHDARLITNALYSNHSLIHLNLECNKIGVAGAEALASNMIRKGINSLQFLGLSYNFVSNGGAIALAEEIKQNTYLPCDIIPSDSKDYKQLQMLWNPQLIWSR
jgi:Ran GTPase-activating protein (RanGAP) involved in mRNA processing and transport